MRRSIKIRVLVVCVIGLAGLVMLSMLLRRIEEGERLALDKALKLCELQRASTPMALSYPVSPSLSPAQEPSRMHNLSFALPTDIPECGAAISCSCSTSPVITVGDGAGGNARALLLGSDGKGIKVHTDSGAFFGGTIARIDFGCMHSAASQIVLLTPANVLAAEAGPLDISTTVVGFSFKRSEGFLRQDSDYVWHYMVVTKELSRRQRVRR